MITEVIDEGSWSIHFLFSEAVTIDAEKQLFVFLHRPAEFWQMVEGDRP
jgi:hypothetical protein